MSPLISEAHKECSSATSRSVIEFVGCAFRETQLAPPSDVLYTSAFVDKKPTWSSTMVNCVMTLKRVVSRRAQLNPPFVVTHTWLSPKVPLCTQPFITEVK